MEHTCTHIVIVKLLVHVHVRVCLVHFTYVICGHLSIRHVQPVWFCTYMYIHVCIGGVVSLVYVCLHIRMYMYVCKCFTRLWAPGMYISCAAIASHSVWPSTLATYVRT